MKINSLYSFAVIISLACPLAAQNNNYYEQGKTLGKKLVEAFALQLKGNKQTQDDSTAFTRLTEEMCTIFFKLGEWSWDPAKPNEYYNPQVHLSTQVVLKRHKELSKGINKALRSANFSKMLKSADSSVDKFARKLLEFEFSGCILLTALVASMPDCTANTPAQAKKLLDFFCNELGKGTLFRLFQVFQDLQKGKGEQMELINLVFSTTYGAASDNCCEEPEESSRAS